MQSYFTTPTDLAQFDVTVDAKPLLTDFSQLQTIDALLSRLNQKSPFLFFNNPLVPIVSVVLYFVLQPVIRHFCKLLKINEKSPLLKAFVFLHSFALAIFSFVVMVNSWPIVVKFYQTHPFEESYRDPIGELWNQGLGYWTQVFYISKYYEFVDTLILILKGKRVSWLQSYHHAGIVIFMYGFVATQEISVITIVLLNSFIHTIMYSYYTLTVFNIRLPFKQHITTAQLIQFFAGIAFTVPVHFYSPTQAQQANLFGVQLYAIILILLFANFYRKEYIQKRNPKLKAKKN